MEVEQKKKTVGIICWGGTADFESFWTDIHLVRDSTPQTCPDPDAPSHPLVRLVASHQRTILLAALLLFWVTVVRALFANSPWLKHFQALSMQPRAARHGSDHLYSHFLANRRSTFKVSSSRNALSTGSVVQQW